MSTFYTTSQEVQQIIKGLSLTKTLYVSSIIIGEPYIGKKSLIRHLFPTVPMVSAANPKETERLLEENEELIITDFERYPNPNGLSFDGKRIIATANYITNQQTIDMLFAFIYTMPPLKERPEDTNYLKKRFFDEACRLLMLENENDNLSDISIDLSQNIKSLRRSIYYTLISQTMDASAIESAIYHYMKKHLEGNNGYRNHIGLFERPLIKAGLEKFGSQLKLSEVLGINRNTLRKKIHEHGID
jgi:DNA-binding protein Fis